MKSNPNLWLCMCQRRGRLAELVQSRLDRESRLMQTSLQACKEFESAVRTSSPHTNGDLAIRIVGRDCTAPCHLTCWSRFHRRSCLSQPVSPTHSQDVDPTDASVERGKSNLNCPLLTAARTASCACQTMNFWVNY